MDITYDNDWTVLEALPEIKGVGFLYLHISHD